MPFAILKFPGSGSGSIAPSSLIELDFENGPVTPAKLNDWLRQTTEKPLESMFVGFLAGRPFFDVTAVTGLLGGKGGFGRSLRSDTRWAKRTTNFDSARDLNGLRLRDARQAETVQAPIGATSEDPEEGVETEVVESAVIERNSSQTPTEGAVQAAVESKKRLIEQAIEGKPGSFSADLKKKRSKLFEFSDDSEDDD